MDGYADTHMHIGIELEIGIELNRHDQIWYFTLDFSNT